MEPVQSLSPGGSRAASSSSLHWRVVTLASIGGGLEFYDFIVFAIFAKDISASFFPATDPVLSLLATYSLFAASYLMRPLGGIVIARFVDVYGRRPLFIWSLVVMSLSTTAMGIMPGHATLGLSATVAFILLRLVQSACFGGEFGTAVTYVVEMASERAGTACGILFSLLSLGIVLATGANASIHLLLSADAAPVYGWRIAFIFGGLLGIVGFYVRGALEETPAFSEAKDSAKRASVIDICSSHMRQLATAFAISAPTGVTNGTILAFLPAYLISVCNASPATASGLMLFAAVALAAACLFFGWISDRTSWIWLHRLGCLALVVGAWPIFEMLRSGVNPVIPILLLCVCAGMVNGCVGQLIGDLFQTSLRATGVTTAYNLSAAIFQGFTPLVATLLIRRVGSPVAPALWIIVVAVFAALAGAKYSQFGGHIHREGASARR